MKRLLRHDAVGYSLSEELGGSRAVEGVERGWAGQLAEHFARPYDVFYADLTIRGSTADDVLDTMCGPLAAGGAQTVLLPGPDIRGGLLPPARLIGRAIHDQSATIMLLPPTHRLVIPDADAAETFRDPRRCSEDRLHLSPLGHERLAMSVAHAQGLCGRRDWGQSLAGSPPTRPWRTEARRRVRHAAPWVGRRRRGTSSRDGRSARRPAREPVIAPEAGHR